MNRKPEERVDKIVASLLRGRRLKLRAGDAEEKEAITAAARLAGTHQGPQRMHPAFRKRLARALEQSPGELWVTRRSALVAGLGLAAGLAGGGVLGRAFEPARAPAHAPAAGGDVINPTRGRWVDVAAMADLSEGHAMRVRAGGVGAFLFRHGDTVTAVSSICSHLPCELWWEGSTQTLNCPCHPASFYASGQPTDPYALRALSKLQVRVTTVGRVEVLGTE
ncbi:MAG TPA: Rieske (2Fe-2S) protein [Candidatus Dormibacteraeota bacterium]|nr:Rieske (2Fe-2S) protein [Candidatus Dormibacteraeota bacterium]